MGHLDSCTRPDEGSRVVQCVTCSAELIPDKRFCAECGTEVTSRCPSCNATIEARFRFCPDCGTRLDPGAAVGAERLDRLTESIPAELAQKLRAAPQPGREERKLVTVLFCDLVGSTAIAESLDPEE